MALDNLLLVLLIDTSGHSAAYVYPQDHPLIVYLQEREKRTNTCLTTVQEILKAIMHFSHEFGGFTLQSMSTSRLRVTTTSDPNAIMLDAHQLSSGPGYVDIGTLAECLATTAQVGFQLRRLEDGIGKQALLNRYQAGQHCEVTVICISDQIRAVPLVYHILVFISSQFLTERLEPIYAT